MDGTWARDVRLALRGLKRRPGFALVAIVILGVGIGANTAMFGLLDAVVLTPLPFPEADRLVQVWETAERDELELRSLSFPVLSDLTRDGGIFATAAGVHRTAVNLAGSSGEPERVVAEMVSPSYFGLLGMRPVAGRLFQDDEDRPDLGVAPVVLGEALWRRRFGSDASVIGTTVRLNEVAATVVGIASGGGITGEASVWTPLQGAPLFDSSVSRARFEQRGSRWLDAVGRLRESVSLESAQAFTAQETLRLREDYPRVMEDRGLLVVGLEEGLLGDVQRTASSLMLAVALLLLITCANLAGLLLARATDREREVALRLAVGASRTRLARELLTESVVLSAIGGALGLLLATAASTSLSRASILESLPSYVSVQLDAKSYAFALVATGLTAVLFGVGPALAMARSSLVDAMRGRAVSTAGGARPALVVVQVALAVALAIGAGLVLRSFSRASAVDPGFSPESVYTLRVELPAGRYDGDGAVGFARALEERLESLPGVERVALAGDVPLVDGYSALNLRVEDRFLRDPDDVIRTYYHRVSPDFFASLGIPLVEGRDFAWTDARDAPLVAVVSANLAAAAWPGESPIGKRVSTSGREGSWREVIGVVGNVRYRNLLYDPVSSPEDPDIFFPLAQSPTRDLGVVIEARRAPDASSSGPAMLSLESLREELRALDAALPIFGVRDMKEVVSGQLAMSRFLASLLVASGGLAAALAALGLYGLLSQRVAERRLEIGIRIAVGANGGDVVRWVMASGSRLVALGLVTGVLGSLLFGRYVESLLFGVSASDPLAFIAGGTALASVACGASYLPARRAARTDAARLLGSG